MSISSRLIGGLLGLPPVRTPKVRVERDLAIPADGGVALLADRYYPVADDRAPLVLIRTPYGRRSANVLIARLFAERGYQVVMQALRGTDGSGGEFDGFTMNRSDGPATIAWLREQKWFAGAFATCGASYLGYAQWDLASTSIPEWKAAIIDVGPSDFFQYFMYPGGAFAVGNALGWAQLVHSLFRDGRSTNPSTMSAFRATRQLARACDILPIAGSDRVATGTTIPYFQEWIRHERYDDYWQHMDYRANADNMPPVVHLGGGWVDFFLRNVLDDYGRLRATDRTIHLLIGSVEHGRNMATRTYQRDAFAILDKALGDHHPTSVPPVRLKVTGRDHWRADVEWPPPARLVQWYLQPDAGLGLKEPHEGPPSTYRYDPADPTPTIGGTAVGLRAGARDNRVIERRADVLTFTSPPLDTDLTVIGPVTATIHIRSSLAHTDVFVRLCDVHPRGRSVNRTDGILRLTASDVPQSEDRIREVQVQMWPVGHVFRRGHRLRLQVSSGAHPRYLRNPGTGDPLARAVRLLPADQEVFHDPEYPSTLTLPVIDAARVTV